MAKKIFRHIALMGVALFCIALTSCINFKPNKQAEDNADKEKEEVVENDPQDDAAMAKSNHLKFKGVPIDGSLKEFVTRMKRKGFKLEGMEDGTAALSGDFADFKECTVYVETLDGKDLVSRIGVAFPPQDQWGRVNQQVQHYMKCL